MVTFITRRVLASIPVLFGVLIVTFLLARAIPGDPCTAALGERATQEACETYNRNKGLDKPIVTQLLIYMGDVFTGDFGESLRDRRPVTEVLIERLPVTLELSLIAFIIAAVVGITMGVVSALYRNTPIDVGAMIGANLGVSMPVFWLGLMLAYLFAVVLRDTAFALPPSARLSAGLSVPPFYEVYGWTVTEGTTIFNFLEFFANLYIFNSLITANWEVLHDAVRHMILPSLALATIPLSIIARMTRSSLVEVLGQDYVRTARAKGLVERIVVMKHGFRNALLPVVTIMGLQLGALLAGAVLTETIFNLAGVGKTLFDSITARDYPVIQAFTAVIAIVYLTVNLMVDISYAFLDPRIRLD